MTPLVSILIPCHNAARWLGATLESALAQTWSHREIIVVDDGSSDHSLAIARSFEPRGVLVITQRNAGAAAARNAACNVSQGDWLQYLDADDLIAPDKISQQLSLPAAALTGEFILSANWTRFTKTTANADFTTQPLCADFDPVAFATIKLEHHVMMHPAAWLVPRALATRAGPWDETLSLDDDGEYFTRLVLLSRGVRHSPSAVSFYRSQVAGSLSGAKSDRAWTSAFRSLELTATRLRALDDSTAVRRACGTAFQRYIYEAYPFASDCRARAATQLATLGGSTLQPEGGPKFQLARRFLGWRLAKRLLLALR